MATVQPNPVDFGSLGFGALGAIPRYDRDFCYGPENIGDPVVPYVRYSKRWCVFVAASGVRVAPLVPGFTASDTDGVLAGLYNTPGFTTTHLGACFDKNGYTTVTRALTASTWELRKLELGVPTTYGPFDGVTPIPWLSALAVHEPIEQEVAVFYLKPAGDKLFCRHERESFTIEHEIATGLSPLVNRLTKLDFDASLLRLIIWGLSKSTGRPGTYQVLLRSKEYESFPTFVSEDGMDMAFSLSGSHQPLVEATSGSDATVDFDVDLSGVYSSVVISDSEVDASTLNAIFSLAGEYVQLVEATSDSDATLDFDVDLSGTYTDVVTDAGTESDAMTMGFGLSGSYAVP